MKSGIKTSELWASVCGVALTLLIGMGVISGADAELIKSQTAEVIAGIVAILPTAVGLWYTLCRTFLKAREKK